MASGVMISLSDLVTGNEDHLIGRLSAEFANQGFETQRTSQTRAWAFAIAHLKTIAGQLIAHDASFAEWRLLLE